MDNLVDKCCCECKKHQICEKHYNPATCSWKNDKYLESIINDSLITCDKTMEETKTVPTNFYEKKLPVKQKIYMFHLLFYQLPLLIAVTIYCCLIKYWAK